MPGNDVFNDINIDIENYFSQEKICSQRIFDFPIYRIEL